MIPCRYSLKVAKAGNNVRIVGDEPVYHEFFEVDAGDSSEQAIKVEQAIRTAFPEPKFRVTCFVAIDGTAVVDSFKKKVEL